MMIKGTTVCLTALALLGILCDARSISQKTRNPEIPSQSKQILNIPFTWEYPVPEEVPTSPEVIVAVQEPDPAETVTATCGENVAVVVVQKDMFGNGQIINSKDLLLGNCHNSGEDATSLIFEPQLHDCQSISEEHGDYIIYTFTLTYDPQPLSGSNVVRTNKATVTVQCYYARLHNVTSLAIEPKWVPFSTVKVSEQVLFFSLKLKSGVDGAIERTSGQYFLGDLIYVEASVTEFHHVPLRVFVESCTASVVDSHQDLTYRLIDEKGCLLDSYFTNSKSKFLARTKQNMLMFQFEAFMFSESTANVNIQITCSLKATTTTSEINENCRACTYSDNRWNEVNGNTDACNSCPPPPNGGGGGTGYNPSAGGGGGGGGYYTSSSGGGTYYTSSGGGGGGSYNPTGSGSGGQTSYNPTGTGGQTSYNPTGTGGQTSYNPTGSGTGSGTRRYLSGGGSFNPNFTGAKKQPTQNRYKREAPAKQDDEWRAVVNLVFQVLRREHN